MAARKPRSPSAKAEMIHVESKEDLINAYKQVFSSVEGQIVLADLLINFGHNIHSTWTPASGTHLGTRPEDAPFYEGQRSVILHIGRKVDARPGRADDQGKVEL